jgi:hypothetical protein
VPGHGRGNGKIAQDMTFAAVFRTAWRAPGAGVASPFTGSWRPDDALDPLIAGGSADGDWSLKVVDGARIDTGSIRAVSLHLTGFDAG